MKQKFIFIAFAILTSLAIVSCDDEEKTVENDSFILPLLEKSWGQSYEEGGGIFRPEDSYDFPPSRFRQSFYFKKNNVCSYIVSAPNDAHYGEEGFWKFDAKTKRLIITKKDKSILYDFKILKLTKDILIVKDLREYECGTN